MSELKKGKTTIAIINYRTLQCTRLCLRCIRRFTNYPHEVLVIDNDSRDESLAYLKNLPWIRLIERQAVDGESGGYAHAATLDLALEHCNTEFFVSMHSDTFVQRENWLTELISHFAADPNVACVGSGKIELIPAWRRGLKRATDLRTFKRRLLREPDPLGVHRHYNRTICCVYRTEVLRRENLSFTMGYDKGLTGGKKLYFELVDRGYSTVELPPSAMNRYVVHLAHATQVFNLDEFTLRDRTVRKCHARAGKIRSTPPFSDMLADASLDG